MSKNLHETLVADREKEDSLKLLKGRLIKHRFPLTQEAINEKEFCKIIGAVEVELIKTRDSIEATRDRIANGPAPGEQGDLFVDGARSDDDAMF